LTPSSEGRANVRGLLSFFLVAQKKRKKQRKKKGATRQPARKSGNGQPTAEKAVRWPLECAGLPQKQTGPQQKTLTATAKRVF
jgi:hypothetical protein